METTAVMKVNWHSRRESAQITAEWQRAVRSGSLVQVAKGPAAIEMWRERLPFRGFFLAKEESRVADVHAADPTCLPGDMVEQLGAASGWFLAFDYSWAVHADHDGDLPIVFFATSPPENPTHTKPESA